MTITFSDSTRAKKKPLEGGFENSDTIFIVW